MSSKAAFNMLGGFIDFDMDLSGAHPNVNQNVYTSSLNGPNCGKDCYCDAPNGGCMELDFIEANGNCAYASTWHTTMVGGQNCDVGGCQHVGAMGNNAHVHVDFSTDGWMTIRVNDEVLDGRKMNPTPGPQDASALASTMRSKGAVLESSQWTGWVPGNCGGDGNLAASVFKVSNLKVQGTVVQGPEPKLCNGPAPTPAPDSPTPSPPVAPTPAPPTTLTPVERYGHLQVKGNKVVDKNGQPVRLQGMSLFWSQWMGQFWNRDALKWLMDDWHVEVVRAAMGVDQGGYLENPDSEKSKLVAVVDAAIDIGIYVIIDWHLESSDGHLDQAKAFFSEMAQKYGSHPNVLFEDWNEPKNVDWGQIKSYHEQVVPVIRQHSNNLIILGTPTWSSEVDTASRNPVSGTNLAYTCHFYAATHGQGNRDKVQTALNNGIAVFATEWGTCEASGNGRLDFGETNSWMSFFEQNHISSTNWAVSDKAESCAALQGGASGSGGWSPNQLTESGAFVRNLIRGGGAEPGPSPGPHPECDCSWTHGGSSCGGDDGSRCWKVCCGGGLRNVIVV